MKVRKTVDWQFRHAIPLIAALARAMINLVEYIQLFTSRNQPCMMSRPHFQTPRRARFRMEVSRRFTSEPHIASPSSGPYQPAISPTDLRAAADKMSASRSYQCLSCRFKDLTTSVPKTARRQFHASTAKPARKSAFPNVSADKMGLTEPGVAHSHARVRPYTKREKELLAMKYTPDQMEAIEVGEQSIGDEDLRIQGRPRTDPMRISYFDDFSKVRPMVDFPVEGAKDEDVAALLKSGTTEKLGASKASQTRQQAAEALDPRILRLSQQTGMTPNQINALRVKNLVNHRVVNQTRMGKIQSLYFLTIAGNENGMLGIGEGKAAEDEDGRRQAMMNAIRNMRPVPRYENRTVYGDVRAKVGASIVELSSRGPGEFEFNAVLQEGSISD